MEAVYTSIILAILCTSVVCAIESQSSKTRGRQSKVKEHKDLFKGAKCGISATTPYEDRIIGGIEAKPHSWPWQVWIECINLGGGINFCGGSIISDRWIITAAHCFPPPTFDIRQCTVLLGRHNLQRNESTQLIAKIADYIIHEKFTFNLFEGYDIALIKLAKPLKFTDAIQPICLPSGLPELPVNKSCFYTGWGITKRASQENPGKLMQLATYVTDDGFCTMNHSSVRMLCTTSFEKNKVMCHGDSGGPLACKEPDRKWYLRGITSYGQENCFLWSIFTKVTFYEKWIKKITSRN